MWRVCNTPSPNSQTLGFPSTDWQYSINSTLPADDWNCPASHPIKGNGASMIFHTPSGNYYEQTKPDECFAAIDDAAASGYRRSMR